MLLCRKSLRVVVCFTRLICLSISISLHITTKSRTRKIRHNPIQIIMLNSGHDFIHILPVLSLYSLLIKNQQFRLPPNNKILHTVLPSYDLLIRFHWFVCSEYYMILIQWSTYSWVYFHFLFSSLSLLSMFSICFYRLSSFDETSNQRS